MKTIHHTNRYDITVHYPEYESLDEVLAALTHNDILTAVNHRVRWDALERGIAQGRTRSSSPATPPNSVNDTQLTEPLTPCP